MGSKLLSINLLPWREIQAKRRRRRHQIIGLLGTVLGMAILIGLRFSVSSMNYRLSLQSQALKNEIRQFALPVLPYPKNSMNHDMAMIQKIKVRHEALLVTLITVGKTLPTRCQLLALKQWKDIFVLSGRCQASTLIYLYLQGLKQVSAIQAVTLQNIHSSHGVFFSARGKISYENKHI